MGTGVLRLIVALVYRNHHPRLLGHCGLPRNISPIILPKMYTPLLAILLSGWRLVALACLWPRCLLWNALEYRGSPEWNPTFSLWLGPFCDTIQLTKMVFGEVQLLSSVSFHLRCGWSTERFNCNLFSRRFRIILRAISSLDLSVGP
jgi:hypothetical protein